MAHRGEAQTFLRHLEMKLSIEHLNFYTNQKKDLGLLISGEGHFELMTKLPYVLGKYDVKEINNYGIAGALDENLSLDSIYEIRTCYSYLETKPQFKSFTLESSNTAKLDCISSIDRVVTDNLSKQLSHFAQIVDRELWSISYCAKTNKIPLRAFKLISDFANSSTECFTIKERAQEYSDLMFEHYEDQISGNAIQTPIDDRSSIHLPGTFTQRKKIESLIKLIMVNEPDTDYHSLKNGFNKNLNNKNSVGEFIQYLELRLNSIEDLIFEEIHNSLAPFNEIGAKTLTDSKKESSDFTIQMKINSKRNLERLAEAIKKFNYDKYLGHWNGNL